MDGRVGETASERSAGLPRPVGGPGFPVSSIAAANVAQVPQRSPLRYPGGKTWLVPHIREWLRRTGRGAPVPLFVEPFAGGGIASLTAVMEGLAGRAVMVERDRDVAAFWRAALEHGSALAARIRDFQPTRTNIERLASRPPRDAVEHGFRTLVVNRMRRGGVLAPGAAFLKSGENGKGLASRWYPETLCSRVDEISRHRDRLAFYEGDGLGLFEALAARGGAAFFLDPPYTAKGGKRAGARLYRHSALEHERLFRIASESRANFLMTYDCSDEVASLVRRYGFPAATVAMKNGHHAKIPELVVTRDRLYY